MSLAVNVFWVEDHAKFFDLATPHFKRVFKEEFALEFHCPRRFGSYEEAKVEIESGLEIYDLALIDYSLDERGKAKTGADLVKKLRSSGIYTEVIFYSGKTDEAENDLIKKGLGLSGIHLVRRDNTKEFVEDNCLPRMRATLAKVLNLTRMRGIMVAEMAEIETKLAELVINDSRFQFCVDGKDAHTLFQGTEEKTIRKAVFSPQVMGYIARLFAEDKKKFERFASAAEQLRKTRHHLAHVPESKLGDEYNPARFLKIRQDILKCKQLLRDAFPDPVTPE